MSNPAASPGFVRRVWRRAYWLRHDVGLAWRYRAVSRLIYFGGDGLGDELLLSGPAHELRRRGERRIGVMTSTPDLFAHSPDVDQLLPVRHDHLGGLKRLRKQTDGLIYIQQRREPDIDVPPAGHILAEMCRLAGITGQVALRPYLFLTDAEREAVRRPKPYLVIQSSRQSASLQIGNKEWYPERFQVVVDALRRQCEIVQLGLPADVALDGVTDLRGQTTLRQSAALLAGAVGFVGLVGMLMHLARAVDCPSVIVYGGREHPRQSGYSANVNLFSELPCSPCWRWNSCERERECMRRIEPQMVIEGAAALLERPPIRPLPVDTTNVEPT